MPASICIAVTTGLIRLLLRCELWAERGQHENDPYDRNGGHHCLRSFGRRVDSLVGRGRHDTDGSGTGRLVPDRMPVDHEPGQQQPGSCSLAGMAWAMRKYYNQYDGFVITHGIDTMAYSAVAVSMMVENCHKPVVFTGAQLPLGAGMGKGPFAIHTELEEKVAVVKITPGLPGDLLAYFLEKGYRGIMLEGFGAGSVPNGENNWIPAVERPISYGVRVVCAIQCVYDGVDPYQISYWHFGRTLRSRNGGERNNGSGPDKAHVGDGQCRVPTLTEN